MTSENEDKVEVNGSEDSSDDKYLFVEKIEEFKVLEIRKYLLEILVKSKMYTQSVTVDLLASLNRKGFIDVTAATGEAKKKYCKQKIDEAKRNRDQDMFQLWKKRLDCIPNEDLTESFAGALHDVLGRAGKIDTANIHSIVKRLDEYTTFFGPPKVFMELYGSGYAEIDSLLLEYDNETNKTAESEQTAGWTELQKERLRNAIALLEELGKEPIFQISNPRSVKKTLLAKFFKAQKKLADEREELREKDNASHDKVYMHERVEDEVKVAASIQLVKILRALDFSCGNCKEKHRKYVQKELDELKEAALCVAIQYAKYRFERLHEKQDAFEQNILAMHSLDPESYIIAKTNSIKEKITKLQQVLNDHDNGR